MTAVENVAVTHQGGELIKEWQRAAERVDAARREKLNAENAELEARRKLAAWLAPRDAQPGEKFSVWHRDRHDNECLVETIVQASSGAEPQIKLRYRK